MKTKEGKRLEACLGKLEVSREHLLKVRHNKGHKQ